MRPFRIGILGIGDGAKNHARPLGLGIDGVALHSVCGRDLARATAFAHAHGAEASYADLDAFLTDPALDAVIVATPDALHLSHAIAAMRAGKHALVEKPLALSPRDAEDLVRMAAHCNVRLGTAFHLRHHAGHRKLRRLVADGIIGEVSHVHMEWSTQSMGADNWRANGDGGWFALAALGSHALDLVAWFAGATPASRANVFATRVASNEAGRDLRVALHAELRGLAASIRVSVVDAPVKYMRISGSDGVAECRNTLGGRGTGTISVNNADLPFECCDPYAAQLAAFAAAVRENRDPEASGVMGALNAGWLQQAGESMDTVIR